MVQQHGILSAGMCLALGIGGSFAAGAAQGLTTCYSPSFLRAGFAKTHSLMSHQEGHRHLETGGKPPSPAAQPACSVRRLPQVMAASPNPSK